MSVIYPQQNIATTRFYPKAPPSSIDLSSGNVPTARQQAYSAETEGMQSNSALPALWWLGILIVFVALRLAYEYT